MTNLFYDLPSDIINIIYLFDRTYREKYDIVMKSLPKFKTCIIRNQYKNNSYVYEYNNIFHHFYENKNKKLRNPMLKIIYGT